MRLHWGISQTGQECRKGPAWRGCMVMPCRGLLLQAAQKAFMAELFVDALKFGGAVLIRRIVGIAHVDDFRDIKDDNVRYAAAHAARVPAPAVLWHCQRLRRCDCCVVSQWSQLQMSTHSCVHAGVRD